MLKNDRPKIKIPYSKKYLLIDVFTFLGILSMAAAVFIASKYLPEKVPMHFDLAGNPDGYGTPESFLIFSLMLPGTLLFLWVIFSLVRVLPGLINFPVEITAENAEKQFKLAIDMLYNLKISIVLLFITIEAAIIWSAFFGTMHSLGLILVALIPTIYFTVDFTRKSIRNK